MPAQGRTLQVTRFRTQHRHRCLNIYVFQPGQKLMCNRTVCNCCSPPCRLTLARPWHLTEASVKLGKGSRSHGEGHIQIGKTPMHARIYTRDPIGRAGGLSDDSMLPHSRRAQSSGAKTGPPTSAQRSSRAYTETGRACGAARSCGHAGGTRTLFSHYLRALRREPFLYRRENLDPSCVHQGALNFYSIPKTCSLRESHRPKPQ